MSNEITIINSNAIKISGGGKIAKHPAIRLDIQRFKVLANTTAGILLGFKVNQRVGYLQLGNDKNGFFYIGQTSKEHTHFKGVIPPNRHGRTRGFNLNHTGLARALKEFYDPDSPEKGSIKLYIDTECYFDGPDGNKMYQLTTRDPEK